MSVFVSPVIVLASYLFEYRMYLYCQPLTSTIVTFDYIKIVLPAKYYKSALNHIGCSAPKGRENASESSKFPIFWVSPTNPRQRAPLARFPAGCPFLMDWTLALAKS